MHKRVKQVVNQFRYHILMVALPLDRLHQKHPFFSVNRFNLLSVFSRDYTCQTFDNAIDWAQSVIADSTANAIQKMVLLTQPRYLGYVFNPVSFWLCFANNNQLIAVLAEVNNRSKQRHIYACHNAGSSKITAKQTFTASKHFYVSPFFKEEGQYVFQFQLENAPQLLSIDYQLDAQLLLKTQVQLKHSFTTRQQILYHFLTIPLSAMQTTLLIHWQAIKLFIKGVKFRRCPPQKSFNITKSDVPKNT